MTTSAAPVPRAPLTGVCSSCTGPLDLYAARSRRRPQDVLCSPCARAEAEALFRR